MRLGRLVLCGILVSELSCAFGGTLARFRTVFGDMAVELYDEDKPVTVQNFIHYIQSGRYQDTFAHRLVPGFVIQGGGFTLTNNSITPVPTYPPIRNEFGEGRRLSNVYGTIAMAKLGGDTNSATAQWYFNLADNTFLDAPDPNNFFVVFGRVIQGTNVLNLFNQFQSWTGTQSSNLVYNMGSPFDSLPLRFPSLVSSNLVFVDISLLQAGIRPAAGGGVEISWDSAAGLTNRVEFTSRMPPLWNPLLSTNGTGGRMAVIDPSSPSNRFYRICVSY